MDTDLSLIEISGEDDSLLQPIPAANGGRSTDYFACSPLKLTRSKPKPIEAMAAIRESFSVDDANKENFNVEKSETLKLSLEPQQMKRVKKGGYNLRKSLAWDRAFFTEEGVLDASELSMISGDFRRTHGNTLSAIQEEVGCNSSGVKTRKENLMKKSPAPKKVGASFLQKERNKEASTSVANRKVLSTRNVNISGSKISACPRPTASSSTLKRPASSITTKASEKDSKVCKPVQKPHPVGPSRIVKSSVPSPVKPKRSQITRSDSNTVVNTRKLFGLKESSSNTMGALNISKAGPAGKSLPPKKSLGQPKRNVVSAVKGSSANMKIPSRTEATNPSCSSSGYGSKLTSNDSGSAKPAIPLSQHAEIQTAKPTGLRMPSPSLGFFAQATAVAQSPVKRISQPCTDSEVNISNQRKPGIQTPVSTQKPPLPPRRLPKLKIDGAATGSIKASNFSSGTSSTNYNLGSSEIMESKPQVNSGRLVEEKPKIGENGSEAVKDQIKLQGVYGGVDMTLNKGDTIILQKPFEKLANNSTDMNNIDDAKRSKSEPEGKDSHKSELNSSSEPCPLPGIDCGADAVKLVECQNVVECTLISTDSKPVSENHGVHNGTTLMESGYMKENHLAGMHSAEDVECQNVVACTLISIDSKPVSENHVVHDGTTLMESGYMKEHQLEGVQSAEGVIAVGEKSELEVLFEDGASTDHANNEDKEVNPDIEIPSCSYDSQPEDKSCPENSSVKQACELGGEENTVKYQEDQDQQMKNSSCESGGIACEKIESPEMDRLMFEDILCLIESQNPENGNTAEVYPEVSSHGSGLENPSTLLRENMEFVVQVLEESNNVTKKQDESCKYHETEEGSTVSVFGTGPGLISQEPPSSPGVSMNDAIQEYNASEVNNFESVLDQGDHNEIELKISSSPTFQDDDAGQNKEAEIPQAEDSPTMEIQQHVQNLKFSSNQDRDINLTKADSSESTLDPEDKDAKREQKKIDAEKRNEGLAIKLPATLVPFSDEWLVALEAAGEDILTIKSGAVQNSPEERSEPKPGPWSPVKRRYQQSLGPFDCTKHTNH